MHKIWNGFRRLNDHVKVPTGKTLILFYVELLSWLQWSRFFTGETNIRIKILYKKKLINSVITVASWLGSSFASRINSSSSYPLSLAC